MSKNKSKGKIGNHTEWNENKNTKYQNVWYTDKFVRKGKFIALNICIRKEQGMTLASILRGWGDKAN